MVVFLQKNSRRLQRCLGEKKVGTTGAVSTQHSGQVCLARCPKAIDSKALLASGNFSSILPEIFPEFSLESPDKSPETARSQISGGLRRVTNDNGVCVCGA